MATLTIGKIGNIEGSVEVVHADGTKGSLAQGAPVYADDAVTTGENSNVRIEFLDGSAMNIGPEFTAILDKDVFDPALLLGDDTDATSIVLDSSDRKVAPDSGLDSEGKEKIGSVEKAEGVVEAVGEDGIPRMLEDGDALYANDVIRVDDDGSVSIRMIDGTDLSFGPGTLARMGDSVTTVASSEPSAVPGLTQPTVVDAAQIATIIQEGRDPTEEATAPAAGETGGNEGVDFTVIEPSHRAVTPTSGHNTHGFESPFSIPEPDLLEPLEPEELNSIPTLIVRYAPAFTTAGPGVVDEKGLPARPGEPEGTDEPGDSETTDGDFIINTGTDGLQLLEVCPLDINGNPLGWVDVTSGGTVTGAYGFELIVTPPSAPGGNYTWSYTLPDNLDHPIAGATGAADQLPVDFKVRVTDTSGDVTPDTPLNIVINDDGPMADLDTGVPGADVTVDESAGLQADDTTAVAVSNLFTGIVANPGVDADMPQYAQSAVPLFTQTIVEGADGATKALTLEIVGGNGTDSGLTTTDGHKIYLYLQNGQVVGRADLADDGASATDEAAFAIAIGADGKASVAQYLSLAHPIPGDGTTPAGSHDEPVDLDGLVNAVLTVTDGDGDISVDKEGIGDQLLFTDDGPTADLSPGSGAGSDLTVDETAGLQADDTTAAAVVALFSSVTNPGTDTDMPQPQYAQSTGTLVTPGVLAAMAGSDEEGATAALTLEIVGGDGTDSGLTTTDGHKIYLYLQNGQVVGRADLAGDGASATDEAAFAIAIDASGKASVVQYLSLANPIPGDGTGGSHDEPADLDGLVDAVLTVTDGDGDTSVDREGIGDQLRFTDDGPVANDDSETQTVENAPVVIDAFSNDVFGADGVDIDNNPATVVTFTQGSVAGSVVSYDAATGLFTYTQAVGQPAGPDTFMYTIEDGDGDTSTAEVTVTIVADSMPTVSVTDGIVDEKGLPDRPINEPAGTGEIADGDGTNDSDSSETTTGTFTITTGSDTLAALEIRNFVTGNFENVTAATVASPVTVQGENGVLTVTSDGAGNYSWSYTLADNLDHPFGNNLTGAADQIPGEAFDIRATDSDGSISAIEVLDITVNDDGPTLTSTANPMDPAEPSVLVTVHEDGMSRTAVGVVPADSSEGNLEGGLTTASDEADETTGTTGGSLTTLVTAYPGADGLGALTFGLVTTAVANTQLPTLFSNGDAVTYGVSGDTLTASAGGRTVFTLTVNTDGTWDFDLQDQLDHVVDSDPLTDGDEETTLYTGAGNPTVTSIDFTAIVTAAIEDADGDVVSDTLTALGAADGSFAITVENDIPTLESSADPTDPADPSVLVTVHEDGMSRTAVGAVPADSSEGNREGGLTTASDEADETTGTTGGSLTTLVTATDGADELGTLTFGLVTTAVANTQLPTLFSNGDAVTYGVSGDTLTASAGGRTVFTLTVNTDGTWDFDLQDQLDHVVDSDPLTDGDEETTLYTGAGNPTVTSIDFTAIVTAAIEDADGDVVSDTLTALGAADGSFAITVENDIPTLESSADPTDPADPSVLVTVHEDGMSRTAVGAVPADSSEGNREGGLTTASDEADETTGTTGGSLTTLVTATDGADELGTLTFGLVTTAVANTQLPTLFSNGDAVTYGVSGDTLTASAGGRTVFTLTVNTDGTWDFDLQDQLDHVVDSDPLTDGDEETTLYTGAGNPTVTSIDFTAIVTAAIEDADGDVVSDTLTALGAADGSFAITVENDIPAITGTNSGTGPVSATVHEDGLSTLAEPSDSSEGIREGGLTTSSDEASGAAGSLATLVTVNDGADEPTTDLTFGLVSNVTGLLPALFSNGDALDYSVTGGVLTATADDGSGSRAVFTLTVNPDGSWDFDLDDQLDHVDASGDTGTALVTGGASISEIDFSSIITATLTDADGDVASVTGLDAGDFTIAVENDIPTAAPVVNSGEAIEAIDTNLMLILDVSGSMGDSANFDGMTRLEVMIKSSLELLEQYDAFGDVMVNIVTFSTAATNPNGVWVGIEAAKDVLLALTDGGGTNYDRALGEAIRAFGESGKIDPAVSTVPVQNISYFMSDGVPTYGAEDNTDTNPPWDEFDGDLQGNGSSTTSSPDNGIQTPEQDQWEAFLITNNIVSWALGMGTGVTEANLVPIGYDGTIPDDLDPIVVDDFADLEATLLSTIEAPPLSGEIISGGGSGGAAIVGADDGGWLQSFTVFDVNGLNPVVYSYDQLTDIGSNSVVPPDTDPYNGTFDDATNEWTVTTAALASLKVDMDTGAYTYTPPSPLTGAINEVFGYTVIDRDGDTASSTATLSIDAAAGLAVVRDDFVITNQDPVVIPDAALLANDTPANGFDQSLTGVTQPADSGTIVDNADDTVTFDDADPSDLGSFYDTGVFDGSFEYTNMSGDNTDTATVEVDRVSGNILNGGYLDEILIGGSAAETLDGGAGDDVLVGDGGNDTLIGGAGDDVLVGGSGTDLFIWNDGDQTSMANITAGDPPANDTVTDFDRGDDDVLNIADLLDGANSDAGDLDGAYISIASSGGDITLSIFSDGDGATAPGPDQKIVLTGLGLSGSSENMINSLLGDGSLVTE